MRMLNRLPFLGALFVLGCAGLTPTPTPIAALTPVITRCDATQAAISVGADRRAAP